ncbi:MAG: hypothetical protein H6746_04270 [Deltaproteobacteria bacterium]|nr:hypothetical protein [Deltaproteobacteria bacterium]
MRALIALLVLASGALAGCPDTRPPEAPAAPDAAAAAPEAAYLAGRVHFGGRQLAVVPFIAHPPEMDLRVQCLSMRDRLRSQGQPTGPLCFDETPRQAVRTLRIEAVPGVSGRQTIARLAAANDSAHFIIEPSGSIYQILDLAYAPRRGGAVQPGEIRVISADPAATERLRAALTGAISGLGVDAVAAQPPPGEVAAPAPPAPPAPPGEEHPDAR